MASSSLLLPSLSFSSQPTSPLLVETTLSSSADLAIDVHCHVTYDPDELIHGLEQLESAVNQLRFRLLVPGHAPSAWVEIELGTTRNYVMGTAHGLRLNAPGAHTGTLQYALGEDGQFGPHRNQQIWFVHDGEAAKAVEYHEFQKLRGEEDAIAIANRGRAASAKHEPGETPGEGVRAPNEPSRCGEGVSCGRKP